jgi:hypothetical protein
MAAFCDTSETHLDEAERLLRQAIKFSAAAQEPIPLVSWVLTLASADIYIVGK